MVTINPNPAQPITACTTETFNDFANKVRASSRRQIKFGNGNPVELTMGSKYSVLALELAEIATVEQFEALMGIIMQAVTQATTSGVIPPDWFKGVTTLFDLYPPELPEQWVEDGIEAKMFLSGETFFTAVNTSPLPSDDTEE